MFWKKYQELRDMLEQITLEENTQPRQGVLNSYVEGLTNDEYHGDKKYFSSSQLKYAIQNSATFQWYLNNGKPNEREFKPSEINALDFGTLVHCLLLEPHMLEKEFLFIDCIGKDFRRKEDKQYRAIMSERAFNDNKILIQAHAMDKASKCVEAVKAHKFASRVLFETPGTPEVSGYYQDSTYNLFLRFRPDRLVHDLDGNSAIIDVKTTRNMDDFNKKANWDFHYDLSACMYLTGHLALTGEWADFYFVVVESEAPFRAAVYKASEAFLKRGMIKYNRAIANISEALGREFKPEVYQACDWEEI